MKREDIEKEALKGVEEYVSREEIKGFRGSYRKGFIEGANLRINSVWHDAREQPNYLAMILIIDKQGFPCVCGPNNENWKETKLIFDIVKWAYIEDLLPSNED